MQILFIAPPMGNWAQMGKHHIAANPLHAQLAAFIREKKSAEVDVLDCRALNLDLDQMMQEIHRRGPDVVFFGTVIAAAGGVGSPAMPPT